MDLLSQLLPIIIYFLLIIMIIVGIIFGIKLIITLNKIENTVDDLGTRIEKVYPLLDVLGLATDKVGYLFGKTVDVMENLIVKLFFKNKEKENDEDGKEN